uniref:non-specific serine/threonine protein kinase n=1 Tax=Nelumbo nucifera TaxID=4432 RepID=A0A822YJT9_NELNU|nr:TPA_asm: hypothetical protein HUJ06_005094 [Nelumbo nucifera]
MATAPELHTASSQKPMVEELSCSASASTPNCSKEFLPDAIRASSKAHDSASVPGSNSSPVSANPRSFQPPPRSSPKQSSNGVSSTSYVTAPDHDTKTTNYPAAPAMHQKHSHKTIQDHLQKEEVPSSLKKSHKSNRGQPLPVDIKDSKMAGATTQEEVLTETNPEPEPCIKNHIDDSKTPKSTCLPKQEGFVSDPCEDPDNSSLAPHSGINRYPSPDNNFCTEAQYIEAKESFAATDVSDRVSSVEKSGGSAKASNSCDFVESRKTSICRGSTGSDVSDESSSSSMSSAVYKPHKGNDRRWEAIQAVRSRDGVLGLNHFRLLRRLGCGDIGSVYLSELTGTRSLFAMKVMDKAALASRKKLLRAQTEREILQSLDHPFLPTLYTHFETEKFSCLVMEFCPGGDLHALRQRQPGKYFPEHAARYNPNPVLISFGSFLIADGI